MCPAVLLHSPAFTLVFVSGDVSEADVYAILQTLYLLYPVKVVIVKLTD